MLSSAAQKFNVAVNTAHLDSSSFHVHGEYESNLPEVYFLSKEASLELKANVVDAEKRQAGRFILATNVLDISQLTPDEMIAKYKDQQASERGFSFLKDPLFFTDSVFLKSPERIEALALIMGLCLLVYTLAQRQLRHRLKKPNRGLKIS